MTQLCAIVLPDPFTEGRFVLCRHVKGGYDTAVESHPCAESAERERKKLQARYDAQAERPHATPLDAWAPRQLVLGFYTDADAQ